MMGWGRSCDEEKTLERACSHLGHSVTSTVAAEDCVLQHNPVSQGAEEQLRRLGHRQGDIAGMWYKDPAIENYSIGLMMFLNDRDALEMIRITKGMGHAELFVVHNNGPEEGFLEIGYVDIRGVRREKTMIQWLSWTK
ncbi:hypothetical protein PIB30_057893 [Stylosanthes scabra]|uniref:Uncharacterized protein n=1 Tax=Stylosanthes scabra TaxID=79078 RepID=A0ABU6VLJ0_9FABA|nr:hypothetical protein [Stylosanthes scabra]